jgi:mannose-6-phosphate isomerase
MYLSGAGVELMANSDNVLRGGLTPKHVDVPELLRVLDFDAEPPPVLTGWPRGRGCATTPPRRSSCCAGSPVTARPGARRRPAHPAVHGG